MIESTAHSEVLISRDFSFMMSQERARWRKLNCALFVRAVACVRLAMARASLAPGQPAHRVMGPASATGALEQVKNDKSRFHERDD
jgi:hypothetical protein